MDGADIGPVWEGFTHGSGSGFTRSPAKEVEARCSMGGSGSKSRKTR
jgi:hypothetical protein